MVLSIIFNKLIVLIPFGETTRILAFVLLVVAILPLSGMQMRTKPPPVRCIFDREVWAEPDFTFFASAVLFSSMGVYAPHFYIQLYAYELGNVKESLEFYLLAIVSAGGFIGRIVRGSGYPPRMELT